MSIITRYSIIDLIKMSIYLVRTKLIFKNARLIRFPFDVRGRQYISISKGFTTGRGCRIEAYPEDKKSKVIHIGKNVQINDYVHITAMRNVSIGDDALLAGKIYISDCTHGSYEGNEHDSSPEEIPQNRPFSIKSVIIKEKVWIGEFVSILPGVTIGKGAIIGSNSVVTKDIPEYTIAVGIPAKPIKKYNFESKNWERI